MQEHLGAVDVTLSNDEIRRLDAILQDTPAELYDA